MIQHNITLRKNEQKAVLQVVQDSWKRFSSGTIAVTVFLILYLIAFYTMFPWISWTMDTLTAICLILGFVLLFMSKGVTLLLQMLLRRSLRGNSERAYIFSEEGAQVQSNTGTNSYSWDVFSQYGTVDHYIYLVLNKKGNLLVDREALTDEEQEELMGYLEKIPVRRDIEAARTTWPRRIWNVLTGLLVVVSFAYVGIKMLYPRADGEAFRSWFSYDMHAWLLLIWIVVVWVWIILSFLIKTNWKKWRRILWRILLIVLGLLCTVFFLFHVILLAFSEESERINPNGTITVTIGNGYGTRYDLYEPKNPLIRKYIRSTNGWDDIEPVPPETTEAVTETSEVASENMEDGSTSDNALQTSEADDDAEGFRSGEQQSNEEFEFEMLSPWAIHMELIHEGNYAIFDAVNTYGTEFEELYDAKGNTMVVVYEEEALVRFIKYDRDLEDESVGQYVYYESSKGEDGSWSWMDGKILDIYQYNYETKEIVDTGKTSW